MVASYTKHLVLGGARSGKSTFAEKLAIELNDHEKRLNYIATATAGDDEMAKRIQQHQGRRNHQWQTIETPIKLADSLLDCPENSTILVDCLTLWLSNCLHHGCWQEQKNHLLESLPEIQANIILVSNEVGSGVVPMGELSREFVDESGWLHQRLAELCSDASLIVAGLPLALKRQIPPCN